MFEISLNLGRKKKKKGKLSIINIISKSTLKREHLKSDQQHSLASRQFVWNNIVQYRVEF